MKRTAPEKENLQTRPNTPKAQDTLAVPSATMIPKASASFMARSWKQEKATRQRE